MAKADNNDVTTPSLDQHVLLGLVGYNCRRAYLTIMAHFQAKMAKYDLRPVEFTILSLLKGNPHINQKTLAQAISVSPPNLAPVLDRLEKRDLLVRERNPMDKREQTLALTPEGVRTCTKAEKTVSELENDATAALSDAERSTLIGLLQKMFLPE